MLNCFILNYCRFPAVQRRRSILLNSSAVRLAAMFLSREHFEMDAWRSPLGGVLSFCAEKVEQTLMWYLSNFISKLSQA